MIPYSRMSIRIRSTRCCGLERADNKWLKKYIQTKIIWVADNGEFVITEFELARFHNWWKLDFQELSNKTKTNNTSLKKRLAVSRVPQRKRAGPITQRSEDQNLALLNIAFFCMVVMLNQLCSSIPFSNNSEGHALTVTVFLFMFKRGKKN